VGALIDVRGIRKRINGRDILNGVDLSAMPGEVFALVGPNGAGKTTTLRVMLGLFSPDAGRVTILGRDPHREGSRLRQRIGFVLERDGLYADLSPEENLDYYARIYGIADRRRRITEVLEFIGMETRRREPAGRLSKGMKRKLAIARALLSGPDVLFLDEPTSGIDPVFQIEIRQRLLALAHEGKTIFINTHNLAEAEDVCSRVAIMNAGRCVVEGALDDLLEALAGHKFVVGVAPGATPTEARELLARWGRVRPHKQKDAVDVICRDPVGVAGLLAAVKTDGAVFTRVESRAVDLYDVFDVYCGGAS